METTTGSTAERCNYCGRENSESLPACAGCGTVLRTEPPQTESEKKPKSKVLAVLLALIFGPLGLCYASISGGLTMIVLAVPLYLVTRGGLLLSVGASVVCAIWA